MNIPELQLDHLHPVSVHIGAVKASRNAQESEMVSLWVHVGKTIMKRFRYSLSDHPVLFSNSVKASFVDTRVPFLPEHIKSEAIAAMLVPTTESDQYGR